MSNRDGASQSTRTWRERYYLGTRLQGISPSDLQDERHKVIAATMDAIENDGGGVDLRTVVEELRRNKMTEQAGGVAYIASLIDALPSRRIIETPTEPGIHLIRLGDLLATEDEPIQEHLDGLLGVGDRLLVPGPPKAGKSLLVRHLVLALATGEPFCGRQVLHTPVPALYLDLEEGEIHFRRSLRRIAQGMGLDEASISQAPVHLACLSRFNLFEQAATLRSLIEAEGIQLLVIDTLRRAVPSSGGFSEKDAEWGARIAEVVDGLRERAGAPLMVAILAHTRKGRASNSPVWEAARGTGDLAAGVDTVWELRGNIDKGVTIRFLRRHAATPPDLHVVLEEDGEALKIVASGQPEQASDCTSILEDLLLIAGEAGLDRGSLDGELAQAGLSKRQIPQTINSAVESGLVTKAPAGRRVFYRLTELVPLLSDAEMS